MNQAAGICITSDSGPREGAAQSMLIVCRSPQEFHLIPRVPRQEGMRHIVASDDFRVHIQAKEDSHLDGVTWLEEMISLYEVADDVLRILDIINLWFKSLNVKDLPPALLSWLPHVEGGMTAQRIQDALILIQSYISLLSSKGVCSIAILAQPGMEWEDAVLMQVARSRGIGVRVFGSMRLQCIGAKAKAMLKRHAKDFYLALKILRVWLRNRKESKEPLAHGAEEVVFQLCSADSKHVGNIVPIMEALKGRGYIAVALCWDAGDAPKGIRKRGLKVEELENWLTLGDLYRAFVSTHRVHRSVRKQEFISCPDLEYQNVSLGDLLWPSIRYFILAELAQRYRLFLAARKYFRTYPAVALKAWGGVEIMEGRIVLNCLRSIRDAVFFHYWVGLSHESPYSNWSFHYDLFLAFGAGQKRLLEKCGIPPGTIALVGQGRYDEIAVFQATYSQTKSRLHLQLPRNFSTYILFDSNYPLRGQLSVREYGSSIKGMLEFAKRNPLTGLIIKPHPSHVPGYLEMILMHYSLANVFLVDKSMLPYHAINAADILVTKYSTIGIEAMLFERPVVSLILDRERKSRLFGDSVEYVETIEELEGLLAQFVSDQAFRSKWTAKQVEKQTLFLKDYFTENRSPASEAAAQAIDKTIRAKRGMPEMQTAADRRREGVVGEYS